MVLDVIVRSSWQELCNFGPFVAIVFMRFHYDLVFCFSPLPSLDVWVKVIVPSLSTLLTDPSR
jgi:hypothetical protein